jgi:PAS domain-containing protein
VDGSQAERALPPEDVPEPAREDARRAEAARRLSVSSTRGGLDRLGDRARRLLRCANAQVSLLLDEHTVVASAGPCADDPDVVAELLALMTTSGNTVVVEDARSDDRTSGLATVTAGHVGSFLGVPLVSGYGYVVGALCAHDRRARRWSQADVTLLEELAASTVAELELNALTADYDVSRLRWDLAIDAARLGTFDWDVVRNRVDSDDRLQELFGYGPGEYDAAVETALQRIHPQDRGAVEDAIAEAVRTCGDVRAEFRVLLPTGETRWIASRGRALSGLSGEADRLLGVVYDVTEVRTVRDQAAHVLASMATGFLFVDRDWTVIYLNAEGERVLGVAAEQIVGRNLWDAYSDDLQLGDQFHHAMDTGESVFFESYWPALDSWYEVRAVPDADGLGIYFLDITERRRAREEAERAAARLDLLGTVSSELSATLEAEEAVSRLARLVVPALGDWCLVTLVDDDGMRDVGTWHVDPAMRDVVREYGEQRLTALTDVSYIGQSLSTGRPAIIGADATRAVMAALHPGRARELIQVLAPESGVVLPLRGRDRTVGLLTLFRGPDREPMRTADLTTAQSVAFRSGLALDNARLYRLQLDLAAGLQRTMLTAPPPVHGAEVEVRYKPAARVAAVGGDWYDVFHQSTGETVMVIGDVVGHDVEAAAAMSQLRGLLRGIAYHSGLGPAGVLTGLDAAMEGLRKNTTATAVVARLEPDGSLDGGTTLHWSNAGHPPPILRRSDGAVEVLSTQEADLLLGIDPRTGRQESVVALETGSTVLLYTDGLVERRAQPIDVGVERLSQALSDLGDLPLGELCDAVLTRMLPDQAEDDVALVAVRLHHRGEDAPTAG